MIGGGGVELMEVLRACEREVEDWCREGGVDRDKSISRNDVERGVERGRREME